MSIWDVLEKAAYTGLGLAALTKEKLDEALERIKKRGFTEEEGQSLAREMREHAEIARRKFGEYVAEAVEKVLPRFKLAKFDEFEALRKRVVRLEKKLTRSATGEKS